MGKLNYEDDYPLSEKRPELIFTPQGKKLSEISMENVLKGNVGIGDCRISPQTLEYQAQIAESARNKQIAGNFRRAAELTAFSDEKVLEIYTALRPFRSTKEELHAIADELEQSGAVLNAAYIREAAVIYEKRKKLKGDR